MRRAKFRKATAAHVLCRGDRYRWIVKEPFYAVHRFIQSQDPHGDKGLDVYDWIDKYAITNFTPWKWI